MDLGVDKKRWKLLIGVAALAMVLAFAVIAAGIVLYQKDASGKTYKEKFEIAEKYYGEKNYEQAIIAYTQAIAAKPEEIEPYIALASIYMDRDNRLLTVRWLERGIAQTKSERLQLMLREINMKIPNTVNLPEIEPAISVKEEELQSTSELSLNYVLFELLGNNSYKNYSENYTSVETEKSSSFEAILRVKELKAKLFYFNTSERGEVIDTNNGLPLKSKLPNRIELDSLASLFGDYTGVIEYSQLKGLFGNSVHLSKKEEGKYEVSIRYRDCELVIETDENGNVLSPEAKNYIIPLGAETDSQEDHKISGTIIDAVTEQGVAAELTYKGRSADGSTTIVFSHSDGYGAYTTEVPAGTYTVTVVTSGYVTEEFELIVTDDMEHIDYVISPELASGEIRIVLEWGSTPSDLDSHLITPSGDEVNYRNKTVYQGGEMIAELDVDDTDCYGPETTTIYNSSGVFEFYIFDFTESGAMAQSGATVKVYLPGCGPVVYEIPSGSNGLTWSVCTIDNGQITEINRVY